MIPELPFMKCYPVVGRWRGVGKFGPVKGRGPLGLESEILA